MSYAVPKRLVVSTPILSFCPFLPSGVHEASASGPVRGDAARREKAKVASLGWIPVDQRCAVSFMQNKHLSL